MKLARGVRLAFPALVTSTASMAPVALHSGWPFNHEHLAFVFRTWIYRAHLARGDLVPIWSAEDIYGLGSPLPLLYHKLFYFVSGALHLATGHMKLSLMASILLFLLVGCAGLYRAARRLGLSARPASLLAASLPLQTYTQVDWLVRGSMAEFSAAMIVPWLYAALFTLVREHRVSLALPASLAALALAHAMLAYFGGVCAALACGILAVGACRATAARAAIRLGLAAAAVLVLLSPYLAAWSALREGFDLSSFRLGTYHPTRQFRPLADYVLPLPWWWGRDWRSVPLHPHPATTLLLLGALAALGRRALARGMPSRARLFGPGGHGAELLVGASLALFLFLQLGVSARLYDAVPGLAMIQFPWRLLAFVQVGILLVIAAAAARMRHGTAVLGIFLTLCLVASPGFHPIRYEWFPGARLEAPPAPGASVGLPGAGEFFPRMERFAADGSGATETLPVHRHGEFLRGLRARGPEAVSGDRGAALQAVRRESIEPVHLGYSVQCSEATVVALPQIHSGLERVEVSTRGRETVHAPSWRTPDDPRVHVRLSAGEHRIRVTLPHLGLVRASRPPPSENP